MNKVDFKKILNSKIVVIGVASMVVVLGAFTLVNAFSGGAFVNIESAQFGDVALNGDVQGSGSDDILGAYGDTNFTNLVASGSASVEGFTQGGGILSISQSGAAYTLTEAEMLASNVIEVASNATGAALTITLPATSTMTTLIPTAGNTRLWYVENNHTAAATTTTLAAGTGIDLLENDGQNVVLGINNTATIECWRKSDTDVGCIINETIPAD